MLLVMGICNSCLKAISEYLNPSYHPIDNSNDGGRSGGPHAFNSSSSVKAASQSSINSFGSGKGRSGYPDTYQRSGNGFVSNNVNVHEHGQGLQHHHPTYQAYQPQIQPGVVGTGSTLGIGQGNTSGVGMGGAMVQATMPQVISHGSSGSLIGDGSNTGKFFNIKYELREEIGVGSTSKCYRCIRKSDRKEFACKVIDKQQVEVKFTGLLEQFFLEIKVLQLLNHPNIIHLEEAFEKSDRIYMVMELMNGGELFDYVVQKGTLSEKEASVIVRKITSAVAHMHALNIIHRDLKPENLLLTTKGEDAEVKLIDFGLAKEISNDSVARSFLGTRGYLAPEILQRGTYDKAIDIWALGVIVFVLLCGCLPFDDDSSRIASESAARKKFALRFPRWASNISASAKDLLHNLLEVDPKHRFTAEQALNHPWVSGRTVQDNNYLQSPSLLGRRELRSPMASQMQAMQNRALQSTGGPLGGGGGWKGG